MLAAGLWGLAAASTPVAGTLVALSLRVRRRVVALVMGFGAGALISALSFDLTAEAFSRGGTTAVAVGLAAGALTFFVGDTLIERRMGGSSGTNGLGIALGALLDGLPESIVLGSTLLSGSIGVSLLVAVALSNIPEGMASADDLRREGHSRGWIIGLWVGIAVASGLAAALGYGALSAMGSSSVVALIQAFAAGAILAMLADSMFPEAFTGGGDMVGLATVLGFAIAFLLSTVS